MAPASTHPQRNAVSSSSKYAQFGTGPMPNCNWGGCSLVKRYCPNLVSGKLITTSKQGADGGSNGGGGPHGGGGPLGGENGGLGREGGLGGGGAQGGAGGEIGGAGGVCGDGGDG